MPPQQIMLTPQKHPGNMENVVVQSHSLQL